MDLLKGLPKGIFRGEERYGAQVDMCHFGLVGSGNPNPSNFRATHMAAATLRPALTPLVADLNGYCTSNAPPWFTWCSIQIVRPQGTDTMGLHSHLRGRAVEGWACTASPQAPVLFNTGALHAPLPWEGERWSVIFYSAGGVLHFTPVWRQQLLSMGFRVPNAPSNPSS